MIRFTVNGNPQEIAADPEMPLLWVLRDVLKLKGTKYGCGVGLCGICTVLIGGEPNHACVVPLRKVADKSVTTIEGLAADHHPVVRAWIAGQVPQCGYCQGGQMLAAAALLAKNPNPTNAQIDTALSGVLCRCGTYQRIREAIHEVARLPGTAGNFTGKTPAPVPGESIALNDFILVRPDDSVTLLINHSEMGQGALTGLVVLAAEELSLEPMRIHTEFAPADVRYKNPLWGQQFTGGSSSLRGEWEPLRRHAAQAREMLIAAAAKRWKAKQADCRAEGGGVMHRVTGARLAYGALAAEAAKLKPPERVTLKNPGEFRFIGKPVPRLEIPDMVAGRTVYGIDVVLPGMKVATVWRPPAFGGSVTDFDASGALAAPGVREVFAIESGIAVVADDFWSASRGREALRVNWDAGAYASLDNEAIYAGLEAAVRKTAKAGRNDGDARRLLRNAARVIEAQYRTPYLAHATIEPMNCVADVRADGCDVWVGTQSQVDTQAVAATISGLPKKKVRVHTQFLGGGFGRRLDTDFVAEAVEISKHLGAPAQVVWNRADDLQHDGFRPAGVALLQATLDESGSPQALLLRVAGSELALDGIDLPYAIPNLREEHAAVDSAAPTGAWRSVGASNNAFATESFIDELAHAAGRDPFEYRRVLLEDAPRHRAVLELAAAKAGWGAPLASGRGRGIAVYRCFGSWVAQVAEVAVTDNRIRVERVVCAIDCGIAVNPDAVRAQMEGSVALGLSAALKEEIRIAHGQVQQANFEDYPILTLAEMPRVEVHIMESTEPPGGVGEPGVPVIAPAVANAVFAATGKRLRTLPLRLGRG